MASPPLLDVPSLVAPIPGDNPAGAPVPFDLRSQLEEARKEEDPEDFAPDDPMRPESPKRADWTGIARLTQESLTGSSKDLLLAARLTEALTRQHGFAGLRDGLHLLRELVDQCWDRLYPEIEDGDLDLRAAPFFWLDDPDHGARFPNTVRGVPVVFGEGGAYNWQDWRLSQEGRGKVSRDDFEKAIDQMPREKCETIAEDVRQCLQELTPLTQSLAAKMGGAAPGMTGLRAALEQCGQLVQQVLSRKPVPGGAEAADAGAAAGGDGRAGGGAVTNRTEAYQQLERAAAVLRQLEPHSPIPYLIQRAVQLGRLPFPDLIKALIREPNVLAELSREFGLGDGAPPAEAPPG